MTVLVAIVAVNLLALWALRGRRERTWVPEGA